VARTGRRKESGTPAHSRALRPLAWGVADQVRGVGGGPDRTGRHGPDHGSPNRWKGPITRLADQGGETHAAQVANSSTEATAPRRVGSLRTGDEGGESLGATLDGRPPRRSSADLGPRPGQGLGGREGSSVSRPCSRWETRLRGPPPTRRAPAWGGPRRRAGHSRRWAPPAEETRGGPPAASHSASGRPARQVDQSFPEGRLLGRPSKAKQVFETRLSEARALGRAGVGDGSTRAGRRPNAQRWEEGRPGAGRAGLGLSTWQEKDDWPKIDEGRASHRPGQGGPDPESTWSAPQSPRGLEGLHRPGAGGHTAEGKAAGHRTRLPGTGPPHFERLASSPGWGPRRAMPHGATGATAGLPGLIQPGRGDRRQGRRRSGRPRRPCGRARPRPMPGPGVSGTDSIWDDRWRPAPGAAQAAPPAPVPKSGAEAAPEADDHATERGVIFVFERPRGWPRDPPGGPAPRG